MTDALPEFENAHKWAIQIERQRLELLDAATLTREQNAATKLYSEFAARNIGRAIKANAKLAQLSPDEIVKAALRGIEKPFTESE